jgi:hypothetical protein
MGWIAQIDNNINSVTSTREGFIVTAPESNPTKVTFEYKSSDNPYTLLSLLMTGLIVLLLIYSRKDVQII